MPTAIAASSRKTGSAEELRDALRNGSVLNSLEQDAETFVVAAAGVVGTLSIQSLRSWLRRPKIEVMFDDDKLRYHQVTNSKDDEGKTLWIRFELRNKGKMTADLEAKLIAIKNLDTDKEVERFYSVNLQCVSEEDGKDSFQLVRGETEVIGLVHKEDSSSASMAVSTNIGLKSKGRQLAYEPGRYLLTVGIYGARIDPLIVLFIAENGNEFEGLKVSRYQEPSLWGKHPRFTGIR